MCCSEYLVRILAFAANFAFALVGVVLLAIGIFYKIQLGQYSEAIPEDYQTLQFLSIYSIIVGATIFFVSLLGCWGTLKSNTCMLATYAAILIVIFIMQVGLGLFALLHIKNEDDLRQQLDQRLNIVFSKYNQTTEVTAVINLIQRNLECCGTTSSNWWSSIGLGIPKSCYRNSQVDPFERGCNKVLLQLIVRSVRLTAIIALSISATELIGAALALYLIKWIKSRRIRKSYF